RYTGNGSELPLRLWERVGVRGRGLSLEYNPSPGSHLRCDIAEASLRRPFLRTAAEGGLCSPTRGEVASNSRSHEISNFIITLRFEMGCGKQLPEQPIDAAEQHRADIEHRRHQDDRRPRGNARLKRDHQPRIARNDGRYH